MLSKSLRRPSNWQDFETLCKKLWGEIWKCPEIKKNGRSGQEQSGVDVYGIPFNDDQYYGIQCKGKDEYTNKQFTKKEILKEIELAKAFLPKLKKLYFATTAIKDVSIEEFIREQNLNNRKSDLFEVHLFCWEDIVDLIDENRQTHDWYLGSENFKKHKEVQISFQEGVTELTLKPKFKQDKTIFQKARERDDLATGLNNLAATFGSKYGIGRISNAIIIVPSFKEKKVNHSFVCFEIMMKNVGTDPIEDYKLLISFDGKIQELSDTNTKSSFPSINVNYKPTTYLDNDKKTGRLIPRSNILVGDDIFRSEDIYLKPDGDEKFIYVNCKLISKDFKYEQTLILNLEPIIETCTKRETVDDLAKVRTEYGEFKDYIETID